MRIPLFLPSSVFGLLRLIMHQKGEFYQYQLKKIAEDAVYSGAKLNSRIRLKWNLRNTLKDSVEF